MFTSTIKAEVTRKHDPTAHYVTFKAAWAKRVSNPAALEQLSIIYREEQRGSWIMLNARQRCGTIKLKTTDVTTQIFLFDWSVKKKSINSFSKPLILFSQHALYRQTNTLPLTYTINSEFLQESAWFRLWEETRATRGIPRIHREEHVS